MHALKIVYYLAVSLAFIASLRSVNDRKYILFIPLLLFGLLVELAGDFHIFSEYIIACVDAAYTAVEYALLSYIISKFIYSRTKRLLIRYSILVLVPLFVFIHFTVANQNPNYGYLTMLIESPLICIWTILYLFESARQDYEFEISRNPMLWISLGNLLFFSGSFFSYGFGSYLLASGNEHTADAVFWIARILNILLYIIYFIGFLWLTKKR
jgi:hypothetical protein